MKVLVACGGTGGHIYPGIAIARAIRAEEPTAEIRFVGREGGLEERLVGDAGFPFEGIRVEGIAGRAITARLRALWRLPAAVRASARILRRFDPGVVVGTGGYVAGPVMLAARLQRRRLVIQEQNRHPGLTNRWVARFADAVAVSFPETARELGRGEVTGNPVRDDFHRVQPPPLVPGRLSLLVFGGSQGAHRLNAAMVEALPGLRGLGDALFVRHQTGAADLEWVRGSYQEADVPSEVLPYLDDMPSAFGAADLLLCRSGASTVAEICAAGRAAVLVPYPHATGQHQLRNAEALAERGAAELVLDRELTGQVVVSLVARFLGEHDELRRMGDAARALGRPGAAAKVARLALGLAEAA